MNRKIAVISDIHGNLEAFEAVLADISHVQADDILFLGDAVGYGPNPNEVIERLEEMEIDSVLGNHELAVKDPHYLSWFNPTARKSLTKTIGMLTEKTLRYIDRMTPVIVRHGMRFVHGFPPDSPLTYQFQVPESDFAQMFMDLAEPVCFVGHTHVLACVQWDGSAVRRKPLAPDGVTLAENKKYLFNIGSVGQPRDGDNRAKYVIFDTEAKHVTVRFVSYDIAAVAEKIITAGLPRSHADRLW